MMRRHALHPLARALGAMLPGSTICMVHQRPWHSLTFAGAQIRLSIAVSGDGYANVARHFSEALPEHEFDLPNMLVADIAASDQVAAADAMILTVDALILDD